MSRGVDPYQDYERFRPIPQSRQEYPSPPLQRRPGRDPDYDDRDRGPYYEDDYPPRSNSYGAGAWGRDERGRYEDDRVRRPSDRGGNWDSRWDGRPAPYRDEDSYRRPTPSRYDASAPPPRPYPPPPDPYYSSAPPPLPAPVQNYGLPTPQHTMVPGSYFPQNGQVASSYITNPQPPAPAQIQLVSYHGDGTTTTSYAQPQYTSSSAPPAVGNMLQLPGYPQQPHLISRTSSPSHVYAVTPPSNQQPSQYTYTQSTQSQPPAPQQQPSQQLASAPPQMVYVVPSQQWASPPPAHTASAPPMQMLSAPQLQQVQQPDHGLAPFYSQNSGAPQQIYSASAPQQMSSYLTTQAPFSSSVTANTPQTQYPIQSTIVTQPIVQAPPPSPVPPAVTPVVVSSSDSSAVATSADPAIDTSTSGPPPTIPTPTIDSYKHSGKWMATWKWKPDSAQASAPLPSPPPSDPGDKTPPRAPSPLPPSTTTRKVDTSSSKLSAVPVTNARARASSTSTKNLKPPPDPDSPVEDEYQEESENESPPPQPQRKVSSSSQKKSKSSPDSKSSKPNPQESDDDEPVARPKSRSSRKLSKDDRPADDSDDDSAPKKSRSSRKLSKDDRATQETDEEEDSKKSRSSKSKKKDRKSKKRHEDSDADVTDPEPEEELSPRKHRSKHRDGSSHHHHRSRSRDADYRSLSKEQPAPRGQRRSINEYALDDQYTAPHDYDAQYNADQYQEYDQDPQDESYEEPQAPPRRNRQDSIPSAPTDKPKKKGLGGWLDRKLGQAAGHAVQPTAPQVELRPATPQRPQPDFRAQSLPKIAPAKMQRIAQWTADVATPPLATPPHVRSTSFSGGSAPPLKSALKSSSNTFNSVPKNGLPPRYTQEMSLEDVIDRSINLDPFMPSTSGMDAGQHYGNWRPRLP